MGVSCWCGRSRRRSQVITAGHISGVMPAQCSGAGLGVLAVAGSRRAGWAGDIISTRVTGLGQEQGITVGQHIKSSVTVAKLATLLLYAKTSGCYRCNRVQGVPG
jgi:hypothetical protein